MEFCRNLVKTIAWNLEIMVLLNNAVISVTLMLNKSRSTCMYVLTLYIMSLDVYTIYIYTEPYAHNIRLCQLFERNQV